MGDESIQTFVDWLLLHLFKIFIIILLPIGSVILVAYCFYKIYTVKIPTQEELDNE